MNRFKKKKQEQLQTADEQARGTLPASQRTHTTLLFRFFFFLVFLLFFSFSCLTTITSSSSITVCSTSLHVCLVLPLSFLGCYPLFIPSLLLGLFLCFPAAAFFVDTHTHSHSHSQSSSTHFIPPSPSSPSSSSSISRYRPAGALGSTPSSLPPSLPSSPF